MHLCTHKHTHEYVDPEASNYRVHDSSTSLLLHAVVCGNLVTFVTLGATFPSWQIVVSGRLFNIVYLLALSMG